MRFPQASSFRVRLKWRWGKRDACKDRNQPGGLAVGRPGSSPVAMKRVSVSEIVSMGSCPRNFSVR